MQQKTVVQENILCNAPKQLSIGSTGKSLSEALIFASTNPQYDDRLFIELQVQYMKFQNSKLKPGENMLCTEIVSDTQIDFCTQIK